MKKFRSQIAIVLFASTMVATAAPTPPVFQLRLVVDHPSPTSEPMELIQHNSDGIYTNMLNVERTVLLDQTALKSATPTKDDLGQPVISLVFTDAGAKQFAEITRQNIHHQLAIIIDGRLCEAPNIMMEITGGQAQISGKFTKKETKDLAAQISAALARQ